MTSRAKKRIALLVAVVAVLGLGAIALTQVRKVNNERAAREALAEGTAARAAGDHRTAARRLGFYLRKAGEVGIDADPELWLEHADSRRQAPDENFRHILEAITSAREARNLMPDDPRPLELLLALYRQIGRTTERLDTAEALLKLDPDNYEAGEAKAVAQWRLGRTKEAMETARALATRHFDRLAAHELVITLMLDSNAPHETVRAYVGQATSGKPNDIGFVLLRARSLIAIRDDAGARDAALRAAQMGPFQMADLRRLISVLDNLEMAADADRLLQSHTEVESPQDEALIIAAERAWKGGDLDRARSILERSATRAQDTPDNLLGWRALLSIQGDSAATAPEEIKTLRERSTPEASNWAALLDAALDMRNGRWGEARERLAIAQAADPANPLTLYFLGEAERNLGERSPAAEKWMTLAFAEPRWSELHRALASLLISLNRPMEAYGIAVRGFQSASDPSSIAPVLARACVEMIESGLAAPEREEAALVFLEECRERLPQSGEVHALLARAYDAMDRPDAARRSVQTVLDGGLTFSADSMRSLTDLSRRHEWGMEGAISGLREQSAMNDPGALFAVALERVREGAPAEAKRMLDEAVESHQGEERAAFEIRRAALLDLIGDPAALSALKSVADSRPNDPQAQLALLQSRSAWSDEPAIKHSIERLKNLAGEGSTGWRVFEARRLLTFDRSERNAGQAELLLADVLKADPRSAPARELAADAALAAGDSDRAIEHLTRALEIDSSAVRIYPVLIRLLRDAGDPSRAEAQLRRFATIEDVTPEMRRLRCALLIEQAMWDLALADIRPLAESGEVGDLLTLAAVQTRRGDPVSAEAIYRQLLAAPTPPAQVFTEAADFSAARGDLARAREILSRAPDEPPGRRDALLADFLMRHDSIDEAERIFTQLAESRNTADAWSDLARFYRTQRRFEEAETAVQRGLKIDPGHRGLQTAAAALQLARGEADPEAAAMVAASMGEADLQAALKLQEAITAFKASPTEIAAYIERVRAITNERRTFFPAWRQLVAALLMSGDSAAAVEAARSSMAAIPTDPRPAQLATEALLQSGQLEQALAAARQWRERSLNDPLDAELMIADLLGRLGRHAQGLEVLRAHQDRLIAQADDRPGRITLLASLMAGAGRESDAEDLLWPLVQGDKQWAPRWLEVLPALRTRPDAARAWIRRVESMLTDSGPARLALGQAWYDMGIVTGAHEDHQRAVAALEPAISDPDSAAIAATLAAASYEQLGDLDRAEQLYREALKLDPENAPVLNNLAYLIITRGSANDEALALADRAVRLAPENPDFIDTRGVALLRLGRPGEAEQAFRTGLKHDGANPALLVGLVESLVAQGKHEDAKQTIRFVESGKPLTPALTQRFNAAREQLDLAASSR